MAGITQIVRAGEADVFHTRLAHTLKVAQVGRRLAEQVCQKQPEEAEQLGVDPEVVEAACLAHDLGHPPFGHAGESTLNALAKDDGGFEGNAQSFRVLTRLSVRFEHCGGLDLTRATLAATLKYPWVRDPDDPDRTSKWGAYPDDEQNFQFAREGWGTDKKTAEAELMDWADDIAYSVHDLEDFHRCNALAWHRIFTAKERERLVKHAFDNWHNAPLDGNGRLRTAYCRLEDFLNFTVPKLLSEPYEATKEQRRLLRLLTSALIGRYIKTISLTPDFDPSTNASCVDIDEEAADEVRVLKQIARDYIIANPSLAAQQRGQEQIIRSLFEHLLEDVSGGNSRYLPRKFAHLVDDGLPEVRVVTDCIAGLTEAEAVTLHARLNGLSSGSVLDPIVR